VFTDVERLCNHHIPRWLATPGMSESKIAAFYEDPVKRSCDAFCADKAFRLKATTLDPTLIGRLRRRSKFLLQAGRGVICARSLPNGSVPSAHPPLGASV